jgi:hypothetical protein
MNCGESNLSLLSRTLNVAEIEDYLIESSIVNRALLVGQILVSRIGNVGWTKRCDKVSKRMLINTTKGVIESRQTRGGHRSWNPLRSV